MSSAEEQAATHVFDALNAQQQSELMQLAQSLLEGNSQYNKELRVKALTAIQQQRQSSSSSASNSNNSPSGFDIDRVTDSLMPFASAKVPDSIRQELIKEVRTKLLDPNRHNNNQQSNSGNNNATSAAS